MQLKTFLVLSFVGVGFSLITPSAFASKGRGPGLFNLCVSCHGTQAEGRKDLAAPAIAGLPKWYLTKQLHKFKNGGRGKHYQDIPGMRMRSMARTIKDKDIEVIAEYVSKLKTHSSESSLDGNATQGQTYFSTCMACHGEKAAGNESMGAPPLSNANDWYLLAQLKKFKAGVRGGNAALDPMGSTMVPMAQTLPDEQAMKDVISYIQSLK